MKYKIGKANRLGNRSNNQDRFEIVERPNSVMLVLADGMGGHQGGLLAANTLVTRFTEAFNAAPSPVPDPHGFITKRFVHAHQAIVDAGMRQEPPITPRTTGVVCIIQEGKAYWAHIGDSRLYIFNGGRIKSRTRDHTMIEELLAQGKMDEKQARNDNRRNHLTRCVGGATMKPQEASVGGPVELEPNDQILLCSDGLWSSMSDDEIAVHFGEGNDLEKLADQIAGKAESNTYPKSDNVSLVILQWLGAEVAAKPAAPPKPAAPKKPSDPAVLSAIDEIEAALARAEKDRKQITG